MSTEGKQTSQHINLPCLGRPLQLGMLYDCRNDQIIPGMTLWNTNTLHSQRHVHPMEESHVEIITEDTLEKKCHVLDIHGDIKLSFLGGLIQLEGSGKYLENQKSSNKISRITFKFTCKSQFISLTMDQLNREGIEHEDAFTNDMATHVVSGVEYGADALFVFDYERNENEDEKVVNGMLKGLLNKFSNNVSGEIHAKLSEEEERKVDRLKCTFHGDIFIQDPPTTFTEAISLMKRIPTLIRETADSNGIYGVPKKVHLLPLSVLDSKASCLKRSISNRIIQETSKIIEELQSSALKLDDLLLDDVFEKFNGIKEQLRKCKTNISHFLSSFQEFLASILPKIRGGSSEEIELIKKLQLIKKSPFYPTTLQTWIDIKQRETQFLKQYARQLQNFPFALQSGDLEKYTLDESLKYVVGFSLASLFSKKEEFLILMEKFCLTDEESVNEDIESSFEDQWIDDERITKDLRKQMKYFCDFACSNSDREGVQFVVIFSEGKKRKLGSIVLYSNEKSSLFQPPSSPGSPTMTSNTETSITISWMKPESGAKCITHYEVSYHWKGTSNDSVWLCVVTEDDTTQLTIDSLESDSEYLFKVRAVCNVGNGQTSQVSAPCKTKKGPSLALNYLPKCSVLSAEEGQLAWYQLPLKATYSMRDNRIQNVDIGESIDPNKPRKILLIVGSTGSGKSTLINGMVNYLFGVSWKDKFRLILISSETEKTQAHSQTSCITAYTFHWQQGMRFPYTLVIIDTPGYGDTRGIARDMEITKQIKDFFNLPNAESVDHLDGIGFVCQASLARLTETQKYIFDSILAIFGKDVAENIFLMLTFADASFPPALDAIHEFKVPYKCHFKLNSSVFAFSKEASRQQVSTAESNQDTFDHMFWDLAESTFKELFSHLNAAKTKSLKLTKQVLDERNRLETLIENLQLELKTGVSELHRIRQEMLIMESIESKLSANKNFKRYVDVPRTRKVEFKESGRYVTNCTTCSMTCHLYCGFGNDDDKKYCAAMTGSGEDAVCGTCPRKCSWRKHCNVPYYYESYIEKEEVTLEKLKRKYDQAANDKSTKEGILRGIVRAYDNVQRDVISHAEEISKCCTRLNDIAMRPDPLTGVEYIDLLIKANEREKKPGWESRVDQLRTAKERAELVSKMRAQGKNYNPYEDLETQIWSEPDERTKFQKLKNALGGTLSKLFK